MERIATELPDGDLECRARSQRRFLEQQGDMQSRQRGCGGRLPAEAPVGLHLCRDAQQTIEIDGRPIEDRQEVLGEPGRCNAIHFYVRYSPLIRTYSALKSQVQMVAEPCPPVPRLTSISISVPFRCSAASGAASSCGSPFSN